MIPGEKRWDNNVISSLFSQDSVEAILRIPILYWSIHAFITENCGLGVRSAYPKSVSTHLLTPVKCKLNRDWHNDQAP